MPRFAEQSGQLRSFGGKERLKVAWATCRSFALTSRTAQAAQHTATATAVSPSGQDAHIESSTAHVSDRGLDVFKALIDQKRFICTQCGKCCTGDGEVWVSDAEVTNIANFLNMPVKRFLEQHTRGYSKVEGFKMLRSNLESQTRDCTFLKSDNTCAIHPVRPVQCLTYPWWPELMTQEGWTWDKANVCEGFDHPDAPPTDVNEAARQLKLATIQEYQKRMSYKPSKKQQQEAAAAAAAAAVGASDTCNAGSSSSIRSRSGSSIASCCDGSSSSSGYSGGQVSQEAVSSQRSSDSAADAQGVGNSPGTSNDSNSAAVAWQQKQRQSHQPGQGGT